MSNTNSNSITSIFVYALNNRKSGFRGAMLKQFNKEIADFNDYLKKTSQKINNKNIDELKFKEISDDIDFIDGTHFPLKGLNGKEVDIYGTDKKGEVKLLIEIKASVTEDLQKSQGKTGEYVNLARDKKIPLVYIIPTGYDHEKKLPEDSKEAKKQGLFIKRYHWPIILDIVRQFDNTGLAFQIEHFVDIVKNEGNSFLLNNKEKKLLLLSPEIIYSTYNNVKSICDIIADYLIQNKKNPKTPYGVGFYYDKNPNNKDFWIGLMPDIDQKYILSIAKPVKITKLSDFGDTDNIYYDGEYYYAPYYSASAKKIDSKLSGHLTNRIKELSLNNWLTDSETPQKINIAYSLATKIENLVGEFLKKIDIYNKLDTKVENKFNSGVGYFFKIEGKNYFLGISPSITIGNEFVFSLAIKKTNIKNSLISYNKDYQVIKKDGAVIAKIDGPWCFFPLSNEKRSFYNFLFSETQKEQQENFNELAYKTLKVAQEFIK